MVVIKITNTLIKNNLIKQFSLETYLLKTYYDLPTILRPFLGDLLPGTPIRCKS